jgi:hypothetical protein
LHRVEEGDKEAAKESVKEVVAGLCASIVRQETRLSWHGAAEASRRPHNLDARPCATRSVVKPLRARAHVQAECTLEEIRDEAIARADRGGTRRSPGLPHFGGIEADQGIASGCAK